MANTSSPQDLVQCTIHLLSLNPQTTSSTFLTKLTIALTNHNLPNPLITARPEHWTVRPTHITSSQTNTALLAHMWDIFLLLPGSTSSSSATLWQDLSSTLQAHLTFTTSLSATAIAAFPAMNAALLHPDPATVPKLPAAWSHGKVPANAITDAEAAAEEKETVGALPLEPALAEWVNDFGARERGGKGAVTMFNLLSYLPDGGKAKYFEYVGAFSVKKFGGAAAKVYGPVESYGLSGPSGSGGGKELGMEGKEDRPWDDLALVHYPSIWHFAEMLASEGYKEVEEKYKKGALRDTCILCVSELTFEKGE